VLAIGMAAVLLSARGFYEPDLWWHLAQGRENFGGHLVRTNTFSFLNPEYRQHYTPWLFDTVLFIAWTLGRGAGIQVLQGVLVVLALGLVYRACRLRGAASASAAILILGFFVMEPRAIPRPHLVSFVGLAACTLAIELARTRRSVAPLRWTIPVVAVWSNFHVEVVFGVMTVALAAVSEWLRPSSWSRPEAGRAIAIALGCAVATLATPYGWGLLQYLYENTTVPTMLNIAELQPAYLPDYRAFWIYVTVATALLLVPMMRIALDRGSAPDPGPLPQRAQNERRGPGTAIRRSQREETPREPPHIGLRDMLTLVIFAALGFRYLRLTPLVFLVTAPAVTARLTELVQRGFDRRALLVSAAVVGIASSRVPVAMLATGLRAGDAAVRPSSFFSEGAVSFARRERLQGPMFNSFNLGGELAWSLYPSAQIFQDSRLQAYPPGFFLAILKASQNQTDWDVLTSHADWAVLSLSRPGELSGVGRFPRSEWATVYWDEAAQVVVRRHGQYTPLVERSEYAVVLPGVDPFSIAARLRTSDSERIRDEAQRNRRENPRGYLAPAVLCLGGDADACRDLDRIAEETPALRDAIDRVKRVAPAARRASEASRASGSGAPRAQIEDAVRLDLWQSNGRPVSPNSPAATEPASPSQSASSALSPLGCCTPSRSPWSCRP
jgi:hypothetical protein